MSVTGLPLVVMVLLLLTTFHSAHCQDWRNDKEQLLGTNAVHHGTMRDWVINLTVVLVDGSVIKTCQRPRKCSAGYNVKGFFVGSEGTVGIVTEVTLKLAVLPESYSVAVVPYNTIFDAVSAATKVIRKGILVAALELMNETQMRIVNEGGVTRPRV